MRWQSTPAEKHSSRRQLSPLPSTKRCAKLLTTTCSPGGQTVKTKNHQTSNDSRSVFRAGPTCPCALRVVSLRVNQSRKKKRQLSPPPLTLHQTSVAH